MGTNPVASCVVFKNGKPSKKDYRHFKIKDIEGPDDFASMEQVISRRLYEKIAFQLSQHNVDLFVGGGKDYFIKREDNRNLINEMSEYEFVNRLNDFKSSESEKIGYLTYNGEPPSKIEGRDPDLNDLVSISLEKLNLKSRIKSL